MPKTKEKHVENLIKGKKSGINIGSRNIPHHLKAYERIIFEKAIQQRFLTITEKNRVNLENIWGKYCETKNWPLVILMNLKNGKGKFIIENKLEQEGDLEQIKRYAQEWISKYHSS